MAIRINLLAEAQAAEEMRRKNPVKLGIWLGCAFVACFAIWILKLQFDIGYSKNRYDAIQQSWKDNTEKYFKVTNNIGKANEIDRKLGALERLSTNRFFWAPVLNSLQQTMIDDIEVVSVVGEQKYPKEEANTTKKTPANVTEKISLSITAKDYNADAQNYDKFKEKLRNFDYFAKNLDPRNTFILDGVLSAKTPDPSDLNRQYETFKLTARYKEVKRE